MKNLIILSLFISVSSFANGRDQLLNCTRTTIAKRQVNSEALNQLSEILLNESTTMKDRLAECSKIKKSLPRQRRREDNSELVEKLEIPQNVKDVFARFANPEYKCVGVMASVGFAVPAGIDISTQALGCRGEDGSQFLLVVPKIALAAGIGACATVGVVLEYTFNHFGQDYDYNPGVDGCLALGLAVRGSETYEQYSVGVGLGGYLTTNGLHRYFAPNIKIAPLPSQYKEIKKLLGW